MARPVKQGLDYFALDVKMDDETELIEAEHGHLGFFVLIKMFQKMLCRLQEQGKQIKKVTHQE